MREELGTTVVRVPWSRQRIERDVVGFQLEAQRRAARELGVDVELVTGSTVEVTSYRYGRRRDTVCVVRLFVGK